MMILTKEQRKALHKVYLRTLPHCKEPLTYRQFRKTARPAFADKCVMVPFADMWLGIERDGYTHS